MRVLVCGGRNFTDKDKLHKVLNGLLVKSEVINGIEVPFSDLNIISGEATGADTLAKEWALSNNISYKGYPADWKTLGKSAGYIRNKQMLEEGKPDVIIAFPGGKGTANMVKIAKEAGVQVLEIANEH